MKLYGSNFNSENSYIDNDSLTGNKRKKVMDIFETECEITLALILIGIPAVNVCENSTSPTTHCS